MKEYNISFYSSLKGITETQFYYVINLLMLLKRNEKIVNIRHCDLLHDVELHEYILKNDLANRINLYPPMNHKIRGFSAATNKVDILEENVLINNIKQITIDLDLLIILPHKEDKDDSGPYLTYDIAKKQNVKNIMIVEFDGKTIQWPDKSIKKIINKGIKNLHYGIN